MIRDRARRLLGRLWDVLPFKRPVLEVIRRLGIVPEGIYRHLHFEGVFSVPVGSRTIRIHSHGNVIENELFWSGVFGGWEGWSLRLWAELAAGADVILDVGANSGIYALVAQAVNPDATVFAFEPVERVHRRLVENARLNGGRIRCVRAAASDRTGTITLFEPTGAHPLAASADPRVFGEGVGGGWRETRVPSVRLDEVLEEAGLEPELIKIDVEGHELEVLEGLGGVLARARPTVLVEVLTEDRLSEALDVFGRLGYEAVHIDDEEGSRSLPPEGAADVEGNVLFRPAPDEPLPGRPR